MLSRKFIGFTSISLYDLVPKIISNALKNQNGIKAGEEEEEASEDTLIDLDELD